MTGLGTAIRSIPFAGFVSFLVTVGPLILDFASGLFESAESSSALGKATEEANKQIAEEQAKMMTLFEQLKQTNTGSERRKELIDQINSTYGTTLQNLSDETAFASQLAGAYAQVNAQLEKKIKTEVFEEELTNLIKQEIGLKQLLADFESGKRARNNALAGQAAEDLIQVEKDKKAIFDALNDLGANVEQGKALGSRTQDQTAEDKKKEDLKALEDSKKTKDKAIDYEKLKLDELNEFKKQKALELLEYESFLLREGSRTREQIDSLIGLEEVAIARSTVDKIIELDFKSKEVLIEHDNAYLKKVEENRIAHMSENEKIIELKAKQDEELAKEKEKQIKDELDAYLDAINKQEEARKKSDEAEQKRKEDAKEALKQELNDLTDFLQKSQELKNDAIEEDIANRQKAISDSEGEINRLQELGTANAAESIKAEEQKMNKNKIEIEALQEKKRDLLLTITALELANSNIQKGLSIDNVGSKLKSMFDSLPTFFKGTDGTLAETLGYKSGRDSHVVRVDNNEMILNGQKVDQMRGVGLNTTSDIITAAMRYQTSGMQERAIRFNNNSEMNDYRIVKELKETRKAISEIQPIIYDFDFKNFVEIIKEKNRVTTRDFGKNKHSL
jgi:hypothetical protein